MVCERKQKAMFLFETTARIISSAMVTSNELHNVYSVLLSISRKSA